MNGTTTLSSKKDLEAVRRAVHIAFGSGAFLLLFVDALVVCVLALAAVLYNGFVAPHLRLDRAYRRPGEPRLSGLVTYPLAVLLLALLLPWRAAGGAWIVLAVADPVAGLAGTLRPRPRVPWNVRKSLVGAATGFAAAAPACYAFLVAAGVPTPFQPALAAAAAGALAETLPLPEDNLVVAFAAGAALYLCLG